MNTLELRSISCEMARAYDNKDTQGEAVEYVKDKFPGADVNLLWAMWTAIDAYQYIKRS